jgi:oligopeptide transport system substrate-binding protein
MKKSIQSGFLASVMLTVFVIGCAPALTPVPAPVPPTVTSSLIPPTYTPEPSSTATPIPSPTPLPGSLVLPLDTLAKSFPWLPLDKTKRPGTYYWYFNFEKPPFNSVSVRQAFAAAIDRESLLVIAKKYSTRNPRIASTFTPPETLGRDLYNEVGIPFNPAHAKELLTQAGFTDISKFPQVTLMTSYGGLDAPGLNILIADEMVKMWQQNLGIKVSVQVLTSDYMERIASNPPEIFYINWAADFNDPDNFLREVFSSGSQYNYGHFSNSEFYDLVDRALKSDTPAIRQMLYIQAERILCETEAAVFPIFHGTYNLP